MNIKHRIAELMAPRCRNREIADVRVGLGYTAVKLDDDRTGVAYTFGRESMRGCSAFSGTRPLAGRSAIELLRFLESSSPLESVLGVATANALANMKPERAITGDVLDAVVMYPRDRVAMIGYFGPLMSPLQERVASLEVFEEHEDCGGNVRPACEAFDVLPTCHVALITSTTIINSTLDRLLEAAAHCREVVLLGSSTPLVPEAFQGTPVTVLSGITVTDSAGILRVVSEGRGTRFFKPFATKWNVRVQES